ncbi:cytochrome c3 family protein [Anaeromyxobacter paludicola]|uniref:Doubled CXXCH motif domain-containing protein n=1 Tax=Anaeromyxobacter paludicola TaxID=2918171 RepID=A0ABN6N5V8_9BACT|nr:cytochrome c3 family protein [Anaeromyxobacter paludicola]BDG07395.1 hypothetical protein AMPC_05080 [Anaeromyxobacter paludicola]
MRRSWLFAAGLGGIALAVATRALDAPHDATTTPAVGCTSCHVAHDAPGGSLTGVAGNANLCFSCHNSGIGARLGFPWVPGDQAVPGGGGLSHRWDATAVNPTYGARMPANAEMAKRITANGGAINCSVCHDQHDNLSNGTGATLHSSIGIGVPQRANSTPYANLQVASVSASAAPKGYLVKVTVGGVIGAAKFQYSNDNGITFNGTDLVTSASPVATDSQLSVSFTGTGSLVANADLWRFYVSYPFLRASNAASAMCEDCHADRVQSADCVEGSASAMQPGGGTINCTAGTGKVFSHPSGPGVTMNASSVRYSSTAGLQVLDPSGAIQASTTSTASFRFFGTSSNELRCMTCHYPHNSDSNALTEDYR